MNCILEIAFLGREEVIGLTLEEGPDQEAYGCAEIGEAATVVAEVLWGSSPKQEIWGERWALGSATISRLRLWRCGFDSSHEEIHRTRDYEEALVTKSLCKDLLVEALILGETNGLEDRHLVPLTTQPFWVRVKGVPLAYMERSTRQLIGDILGRFIETDSERGGTCLGSFMKIKCSFRDSVINHGDFKNFGSWLRAKVKEWLDEPEMKSPRPLRPRWVMKAPSSNELGLVDE
ncbi:PREDICTED: PRUPE_7G053200 partial, partial [Prunus dulcis]